MLKTLRYNILLACCLTIATTAKAQIDSLSAVPIEQEQPLVVVDDSLDGFLDAVSIVTVAKRFHQEFSRNRFYILILC